MAEATLEGIRVVEVVSHMHLGKMERHVSGKGISNVVRAGVNRDCER